MEIEISSAVENLRKAMIDADKSSLDDLTAEELNYGHSNGNVEDKHTFVESIVSGKDNFKTIELTEKTVNVINDLAIARHRFKAELFINGEPFSANIGVMQIWRKDNNSWKLLARQAFKM